MKAFNNLKIGAKLIVGFVAVASILVFLIGFSIIRIQKLGEVQDAGSQRALDAIKATEAKGDAAMLYRVIADAEINLDFQVTETNWNTAKHLLELKTSVVTSSDQARSRLSSSAAPVRQNQLSISC